ncbi:vWA domain-containing protein [Paraliomyxa miuraensis]|uniref:vWA domain-containing protein n=1 Tax=Paraliomyxa miuraensis TaxID=376150 RepID=UPI00224DEF3F|nr:VWA domain-containing protein [Paraliomyxa miuraensis]MCX4246768.1 VWA domain-containing protein [Paraliomyxa miuraensis]
MHHAAWIRTASFVTSLGLLATTTACGTSSASTDAGSRAPLAAAPVDAAPAHTFTPRRHPPRVHEPAPPPNLASLPPLTDRTRACFGWPEPVEAPPPPTRGKKKHKRTPSAPPGFVPYGGGGSGKGAGSASTKRPAKDVARPASKSSGSRGRGGVEGGVPGGVVGGVVGGVASGAAAPSTPAAEPAPTAPAADRRTNEARKQRAEEDPARGPLAQVDDEAEAPPSIATDPDDGYHDWGAAIYLSNDDTMSLSSAQRVIYAIDNFLPLPAEHIRPHELLNYFSFDTQSVAEGNDFSVDASIEADPDQEGIYSLAMAVRGRPVTLEERRNANLSLVIDRSGSMSAEGRMEYLKRGLRQMLGQLKTGDMVHLVLFDHDVCAPVENFVVGRDRPDVLMQAIDALEPRGSTDLHAGLGEGYRIADRSYQPTYSNRVVMITDAIANTGVTDEQLIATVGKFYDARRIRLSGVGVGRDFNDSLLDRLTERGKGAYVFLGSEAEVDAVFGSRFISLVETTALDVHFRLHLPPSLRMNVFYGEESSTVKEDVQAIHYFANTSQLFLSDLMARNGEGGGQLRLQDDVMLTVEYEDPETGDEMVEEYAFNLGEISRASRNVRKGRMIMRFIDGLSWMASRPTPGAWGTSRGGWDDAEAWEACAAGRGELAKLAKGLEEDPEVHRVTGLWDQYCARFSQPREPVRRDPPSSGWPSASGR